MKRNKLFVSLLASLVFGLLITLATSHNIRRHVPPAADCGYSIDGKTGAHVTLTECQLSRYGWPRPYLVSDMQVVLRDYHAPVTGQVNRLTGSVAAAHLEVGALLVDIVIWSVAGFVVGLLGVNGLKRLRRKAATPVVPPATLHE